MVSRKTLTNLLFAAAIAILLWPATTVYGSINENQLTFPLDENFESEVFPPSGWNVYDLDGLGVIWEPTYAFNHTPGGSVSAYHGFAFDYHDGWLVTPAIAMPSEPPIVLAFWNYTVDPSFYGKNSVAISTGSGNPADGDFVEIWTATSVVSAWQQVVINLADFAGETVYVAFRYEGDYAHGWAVDDVFVGSEFDTSPQIVVTPETINATAPINISVSKNLTVANAGVDELLYSLEINYAGGSSGWLSADPLTGVVGSNANLIHTLNFNPSGLDLGDYTALITINSNDPANPEITIPVNFTVIEASTVEVNILLPELTFPVDISESGEYVAISGFGSGGGWLWSKSNGLIPIIGIEPLIQALANDGVVAGTVRNPEYTISGEYVYMSAYWHPQTGEWTYLPLNPAAGEPIFSDYNSVWGMTADGATIVGMQYFEGYQYRAYKWTEAGGYVMIGDVNPAGNRPNGISNDGSVVYGWANLPAASRSPVIWYNDEFIQIAPDLFGEAFGASSTGEFVVGYAGEFGFVWNPQEGTTFFENTLNTENLNPLAVSDDGTIFGYTVGWPPFPPFRNAFVRLPSGEMLTFNDYALSRGMADASDWTFLSINGVTPDGNKVIGSGITPDGQDVSFMIDFSAEIPNIVVTPESLTEVLASGQISVQELLVQNIGNGELSYEMFINYLQPAKRKAPVQVPDGKVHSYGGFAIQSAVTFGGKPKPQAKRNTFVLNYDGNNVDAIGLTAGGTFFTAVRFPASLLVPFAGANLQSVDVYINDLPASAQLFIWGAGTTTTPGNVLHDQNFVVSPESWNNISLSEYIEINNEDIWVGFSFAHSAGNFVAGIDGGPANPNGGFISQDAMIWEKLTDYGLNSNWNIRANLQLGAGNWLSLDPQAGTIPAESQQIIEVTFNAGEANFENNAANIIITSNDPQNPMMYVPVLFDILIGINQKPVSDISVYPIPTTGFLYVDMADNIQNMRIINGFGQVVMEKALSGETATVLDLRSFLPGIYTLQTTSANGKRLNRSIIISK